MSETVHITFGRTVIAVRRDLAPPNDPVLRRQLEAKLQEYRKRLQDPDMTAHREASTNYKIWVLQQLLDEGSLDFLLLKAAVSRDATNQTLAIAYLAYAWKVIENYCYNRGAHNRGGTGLPANQAAPFTEPVAAVPYDDRPRFGASIDERQVVAIPMEEREGKPRRSRIPLADLPAQADQPMPFTYNLDAPSAQRAPLVLDDEGPAMSAPFA